MTRFPAPDRSTYRPNRVKTEENPQLDIGWAEGGRVLPKSAGGS